MSLELNFTMQNKIRFKEGKRDQGNRLMVQFLSVLHGEVAGFRGYMIMNSTTDSQSSVVQTFWETKTAMDRFYATNNAYLSNFLENLMPLVEKAEQIQTYQTEIADLTHSLPIVL